MRAIFTSTIPAPISAVFSLAVLFSVGCGGQSALRITTLDLDPVLVTGGEEDEEDLQFASAAELFESANDLLSEDRYLRALRRYRLILEYFSDSPYERATLYNTALCYEGLDDWESAAAAYQEVVERWPASRDATDALYRWAEARAQLGDWEGVVPLMDRALRRTRLTLVDRLEAHLRWANAALEMRDYASAEQHYRMVLRLNRDAEMSVTTGAEQDEQPLPDFHPIIVQSSFGLGRTYHELFLEIKLILPEQAIYRALTDKSQLMEQARLAYLEAVRAGHIYWSPAAGFMIGQLYEDFFLDVLACEVPHEFDELTLDVYFDELRSFLQPIVERAMVIYEETLAMSERLGADSIWVEEARLGLDRLRGYLEDPEVQEEQERLIRNQQHPHGAQDPSRRWIPPEVPDT